MLSGLHAQWYRGCCARASQPAEPYDTRLSLSHLSAERWPIARSLLSLQAGHCRLELSGACRVRRPACLIRAAMSSGMLLLLLQRQQLPPELGVVGGERPQLELRLNVHKMSYDSTFILLLISMTVMLRSVTASINFILPEFVQQSKGQHQGASNAFVLCAGICSTHRHCTAWQCSFDTAGLTSSSAVALWSLLANAPSPRQLTSWVRVSTCALRWTRSLSAAARSAASSCTWASLVRSLACGAQQTLSARRGVAEQVLRLTSGHHVRALMTAGGAVMLCLPLEGNMRSACCAPADVRGTLAVPSTFLASPDHDVLVPGGSPLCRSSLLSRVLQLDAQPAWSEAVACCLTPDACRLLVAHLALQSTAASAERDVPVVSTSLVASVQLLPLHHVSRSY